MTSCLGYCCKVYFTTPSRPPNFLPLFFFTTLLPTITRLISLKKSFVFSTVTPWSLLAWHLWTFTVGPCLPFQVWLLLLVNILSVPVKLNSCCVPSRQTLHFPWPALSISNLAHPLRQFTWPFYVCGSRRLSCWKVLLADHCSSYTWFYFS